MKILFILLSVVFLTGCQQYYWQCAQGTKRSLRLSQESVAKRAKLVEQMIKEFDKIGTHRSPLDVALSSSDIELFEYLLKNGADLNELDYRKRTVLSTAVGFRDFHLTRRLLELGADPMAPATNPLNEIGNRNGTEGTYRDGINSDYNIAKLLIDHGAVPAPTEWLKETPLFCVYDYDTAKLYLDHGVDIHYKGYMNRTAFMHLIRVASVTDSDNAIKMMQLYLEYGADINVIARDHSVGFVTVLDRALLSGKYPEIICFLRENGAKTADELQKTSSKE